MCEMQIQIQMGDHVCVLGFMSAYRGLSCTETNGFNLRNIYLNNWIFIGSLKEVEMKLYE